MSSTSIAVGTAQLHGGTTTPQGQSAPTARAAYTAPSPLLAGAALVGADAAAWCLCILLGAGLSHAYGFPPPVAAMPVLTGLVWLGLRAASGLYPSYGLAGPEELRRSVLTIAASGMVYALALAMGPGSDARRWVALVMWLPLVPLSWFVRHAAKRLLLRAGAWGVPYVVVGTPKRAARVIVRMRDNIELGLVPVGAFVSGRGSRSTIEGVPVLGSIDSAVTGSLAARHVILALKPGPLGQQRVRELTSALAQRHVTVELFHDLALSHPWVHSRALGAGVMLRVQCARFSTWQQVLKRCFDLTVAVPLFLVTLPVVATAAVAIRVRSPGPALFSQVREGRRGRQVLIWKLRTMVPDAEQLLAEHLASDPLAFAEYERTLKLCNDPRIIPGLGRLLRRTSIDELPQLWNVLKGDISLVGPRVMPTREVDLYSADARDLRRDVPPGLTGLWQVLYRNDSTLGLREDTDCDYVNNWSIWLDAWIVLRTAVALADTSGAY